MAVIRIGTFGGEQPSISSRELALTSARKSVNLDARSNEFRPLKSNLTVATATVTGEKKLTRFTRTSSGALNTDMTTSWITGSMFYDSAVGQINDNKTSRIYYSRADGSAPPYVGDVTTYPSTKLLGVPVPTQAIGTTTEVPQYTPEKDAAARVSIPGGIAAAVANNATPLYLGINPTELPSTAAAGWLTHTTVPAVPSLPTTNPGDWAYLAPMMTGAGGGLVMKFPEAADALLAPGLGGRQVTYQGNPYWAISVALQGRGYTINRANLITAVQAIPNPATGVAPLFADPSSSVDEIIASYAVTKEPLAGLITQLNAAIATLSRVYNTSPAQAVEIAATRAFFLKSDVVADINAAINSFASSVLAVVSNTLTPVNVPFTPTRGGT